MKYTVYLMYDEAGALMYVGCTKNLEQRKKLLRSASPWYERVDRIETEEFATSEVAGAVEHALIRFLKPIYTGATRRYSEKTVERINGQKLKALRLQRDLTQQALAVKAGHTRRAVGCIERAVEGATVTPRTLRGLASALGVEPGELQPPLAAED